MENLEALRNRLMQSGIASYKDTYKESVSRTPRRYDVYVGNTLIDGHLMMAQARRLRDEYRIDGVAVKIIEYCAPIEKQEFQADEFPQGKQNFETPSITPRRAQTLRNRRGQKKIKTTQSSSIRYTGYGRDKNSPLHKAYLNAVQKDGFTIKQDGRVIFIGMEDEVTEFLLSHNMDDLEIIYNGKKK